MDLTSEQRMIQETVRGFVDNEVTENVDEADEAQEFPEEIWDGLADLNLTGLTVSEEYGGFDSDEVTYSIVNEELARGHLAVTTVLSVHGLATSCICQFGTQEQQDEWLSEMVDGRPVGAFALSESHTGSNLAEMTTEAYKESDQCVINGKKQWITNGERARHSLIPMIRNFHGRGSR